MILPAGVLVIFRDRYFIGEFTLIVGSDVFELKLR